MNFYIGLLGVDKANPTSQMLVNKQLSFCWIKITYGRIEYYYFNTIREFGHKIIWMITWNLNISDPFYNTKNGHS